METFKLDMGGGDDEIIVGDCAELCIMFYEPNKQGGIISMGDGDDTLNIQEGGLVKMCYSLDMGAGDDTLILDGVLYLYDQNALKNIETISGSGTLFVGTWADDEFIREIESTGISVKIGYPEMD